MSDKLFAVKNFSSLFLPTNKKYVIKSSGKGWIVFLSIVFLLIIDVIVLLLVINCNDYDF